MTVKVRWIEQRQKYYLVVHHEGQRKSIAIGKDEEEAEEARKQLELKLRLAGVKALAKRSTSTIPTFGDYGQGCIDTLGALDLKESTIERHTGIFKIHLKPEFGHVPVDQVTYSHIKAWVERLAKGDKKNEVKALARNTIRNHLATLRMILDEAKADGFLPGENPAANKRLRRFYSTHKAKKPIEPFTTAELDKIEQRFQDRFPWEYPLVACLIRTGIRMGEAAGLKWPDVDFTDGVILIRRSWPHGRKLSTVKTKAGRRRIRMTEDLARILKAWRGRVRASELEAGRAELPKFVFVDPSGKPFDYSNFLKRRWNKVLEQTEEEGKGAIRRRSPHTLRHTFASMLLSQGTSITRVAHLMGHARPSTTLGIYSHFMPEDDEDLSAILDRRQPAEPEHRAGKGTE